MSKEFQQYMFGKEFHAKVQELKKRGGVFTKAAMEAMELVMKINSKIENPFGHMNLTHHGESRIRHCIKYDLPGAVRLVTIQDNGVCLLAYIGDHDDTEAWLESKKGVNLTIDKKNKVLVPVRISEDIFEPEKRVTSISDYSEGLLYRKLKDFYFKKIAQDIPYNKISPFLKFDSTVDEDEILNACHELPKYELQSVFFDVFHFLKSGDVDEAEHRILEYENELMLVSEASKAEVLSIQSNDQYVIIQELEAEFLKGILETKGWYEWMAFLHPDQKKVVKADFKGSARLLGVSGSGKTSILVHRAVRLAEKTTDKPVLIITLNESLSKLINKLVDVILSTKKLEHLREKILVKSYWQVCKELIIQYRVENPSIHRTLSNVTDKTNETIDEIWDEFYCMKNNNEDAKVIFPLHQNLLARNLYPLDYLRQEFDWVRSAFPRISRADYLSVEREGRYIPIIEDDRKRILEALTCWENKMEFVGVIDYLGLSNVLYEHIDAIEAKYSNILVDEVQDFGTLELMIIRKLAASGENDLFLCGDIAQQVYNKQHKLRTAGITILPEGFLKIIKNYRNSREILEAAYSVYEKNVDKDKLKSDEFEILNPEYANFSSPKPFLRKGESSDTELHLAIKYLDDILDKQKQEKGCVAICGASLFSIIKIGEKLNIPVLSGNNELAEGAIFLSDLEQTKGFEFDRVVIINCNDDVFPNKALPMEEWYREISKLYVAMTRAKKELIISYSHSLSGVFNDCREFFTADIWNDHLQNEFGAELEFPELTENNNNVDLAVTGLDFLYTKHAIGVSRDLQIKLSDMVAGKSITDHLNRKIGWPTMDKLKADVLQKKDLPTLTRLFGPVIFKELEGLMSKLV